MLFSDSKENNDDVEEIKDWDKDGSSGDGVNKVSDGRLSIKAIYVLFMK